MNAVLCMYNYIQSTPMQLLFIRMLLVFVPLQALLYPLAQIVAAL
jgi:hypothetical protein